MAKVLTGIGVAGGALATPFVLKHVNANSVSNVIRPYLERLDECTKLLEEQHPKRTNESQIYLCTLREENKLEMVYFENEGGRKSAKKIQELEQRNENYSKLKLIVTLDGGDKRELDWPNLLFNYTNSGSNTKTTLNPEQDCYLTPEGSELFKCNSTLWTVIKQNPNKRK